MADSYLPVWVYNLPARFFFQPDGALRENISGLPAGVVKIIAGPEFSHVRIDIRRPYFRPINRAAHVEDTQNA